MKKRFRRIVVICTVFAMVLGTTFASAATKAEVTSLDGAKAKVQVDWNHRYTYEELGKQLKDLKKPKNEEKNPEE